MAIRVYLMPIVGTGMGSSDPRRPKYVNTFLSFTWDMVDYGLEPVCLVGITDVSPAIHTSLTSNPDVTALPADLTQNIGAQLTLVQNALSAMNIPEDWVKVGFSYVQVLRVVALVFLFMQRLHATLPGVRLFDTGVTLATRINQLPANVKTALATTATSLGFDTNGLTGPTTLRVALKAMADQFPTIEVNAFGTVL